MVAEPTPMPRWPLMVAGFCMAAALAAGFKYHQTKEALRIETQRNAGLEQKLKAQPAEPKLAPALTAEQTQPLLENLKPLLKLENEDLRARAVELMVLVDPKGSEPLLAQVLCTDPSVKVKLISLDVAGRQKIAACRGEALNLLLNQDPALRRKAAWCLGALGREAEAEMLAKVREGLLEALRKENEQWVKELLAAQERAQSTQPQGSQKAPSAALLAPAPQAYGSHGPYIQALGEVGDAETAKRLQFYLESQDPLVRRETVLALGSLGREESAAAMIARFRAERDELVASAITQVLTGPAYKMKFDTRTRQFSTP